MPIMNRAPPTKPRVLCSVTYAHPLQSPRSAHLTAHIYWLRIIDFRCIQRFVAEQRVDVLYRLTSEVEVGREGVPQDVRG
jgi:hypothetical protein